MKIASKINDTLNLLRSLNFTRLSNLLKLYSSYYFSILTSKNLHSGLPFSVSIEPTSACNLHCPECPTGMKTLTRPTGNLSPELFKKTIDELEKQLIYLTLYFQGEPFLNKNFFDFVKYAKSKNIYTATSTNAHFLDEDNCRKIIDSGLDSLIISMDGVTQDAYSSYRKGGDIVKVKEGINRLIALKKKLGSKKPYTILQFLVLKTNGHQINEIKEFAKKAGIDEMQLKTAQFYNYENGNPLMPSEQKYSRYIKQPDSTYRIKGRLKNKCFRMWSSCVISWDGRIIPCCFDKDASHEMGNIQNSEFSSVWYSNEYNTFRKKILYNRKSIDICCNCTEGLK